MKKVVENKVLIVILVLLSILTIFTTHTYALGDIISSGDKFEDARANYKVNDIHHDMEIETNDTIDPTTGKVTPGLKTISSTIYNILLLLGIIIAVIVGIVLGIKFMTGSIEEQAKVKESLVPYIAGCAVIFGAFTIWKIALEVLKTTV